MPFFFTKNQERLGEVYVFLTAVVFAAFPVLIHYASQQNIPGTFYAAISHLVSALLFLFLMAIGQHFSELRIRAAWLPMLMTTLFIIAFPLAIFYNATQYTSAINTSILLEAEIFFALVYTWLMGERMTIAKITGGLAVFLGTFVILYNGTLSFNLGDLLIVLSTAFYPIGNLYAKKALALVSPTTLVFVRSLLGTVVLFALSLIFDDISNYLSSSVDFFKRFWLIILFNGLILSGAEKLFWYEGLKRLDVSKATIIVMTYPALSLILATILLNEIPTLYQFFGLLIIFFGLYQISDWKKEVAPVG